MLKKIIVIPVLLCLTIFSNAVLSTTTTKSVGILYEIWHCGAADSYAKVKSHGYPQLTTELVLQSNGNKTLDDVFPIPTSCRDIYNVQPKLGFYCLCSPRTSNETYMPNCPNIKSTLKKHAEMLYNGGFDYIAIDITNWPIVGPTSTDVSIIRPLENLFEEWLELRSQGYNTPDIALWVSSPFVNATSGTGTMWQYLLDHFYNNETRAQLIWHKKSNDDKNNNDNNKLTFFLVGQGKYNSTVDALIQKNGGRNNINTVVMWALFGETTYENDVWGFFSACVTPSGGFTTSQIGTGGDCNQYSSSKNGKVDEISASGGYMLTQCSLPFASPGHMRGLVMQRLFKKILNNSPENVFLSSFNEHIGGRQPAVFHSNVAYNMGLPNDPQKNNVWVDTYGAEFSRDIEPTVEGGSKVWDVTVSCIEMYKKEITCKDSPSSPCCTTYDKLIWYNAYSLINTKNGDSLITNSINEKNKLINNGSNSWKEVCHSIAGPSVFCVDGSIKDGRNGPFMLFNIWNATNTVKAVYRCISNNNKMHYLSNDLKCEGFGTNEFTLGYTSTKRGVETLRELFRCESSNDNNAYTHSLDLKCDVGGISLGFVR